jgi:hypothetical protein
MQSQSLFKRPFRTAPACWTGARVVLPVLALCHCGDGDASTAGTDAAVDAPQSVIIEPSASPSPGDAEVDAVAADGASADASFDASPGDGAAGNGEGSDCASGDAGSGDAGSGDATSADGATGDTTNADTAIEGSTADAAVDTAPACPMTATPKDNACVLDPALGVFVAPRTPDGGSQGSPSVSDAGIGGDASAATIGDGSPSNPYSSISIALQNLGAKARVYVCDGTYSEQVTVTTPVSLFGGLSCAGGVWRWDGGATQVLSPTASYALSITGLNATAIDVQDLAFTVPDATAAGASSVAAVIAASTVTLTRVVMTAGRGANGEDGAAAISNWGMESAPNGPSPGSNLCINRDSSTGGAAPAYYLAPQPSAGTAAPPAMILAAPFDGKPGVFNAAGDPGANGWPRSAGGPAANSGTIAVTGNAWLPSQGTDGSPGGPGQGGGGGGGWDPDQNMGGFASGSGGSAGGCGGGGGSGGRGGGGSIALLSNGASVSLVASTLIAGQGGAGGNGGPGQDGQPGGLSESSGAQVPGASGGAGGNGAGGSGGGGGSGGVSVGILFRGVQPVVDGVTGIAPGPAGAPGAGGLPGSQNQPTVGNSGSPGLAGVSEAFLGGV